MQSQNSMSEPSVRICLVAFSGTDRTILTDLRRQFTTDERLRLALQKQRDLSDLPDVQIEIRSATTKTLFCSQSRKIVPTVSGWDGADGLDLVILVTGKDPLAYLPMGLRGLLMFADQGGATLATLGDGARVLSHLHYVPENRVPDDGIDEPIILPRRIVVPEHATDDLVRLFAACSTTNTETPPKKALCKPRAKGAKRRPSRTTAGSFAGRRHCS